MKKGSHPGMTSSLLHAHTLCFFRYFFQEFLTEIDLLVEFVLGQRKAKIEKKVYVQPEDVNSYPTNNSTWAKHVELFVGYHFRLVGKQKVSRRTHMFVHENSETFWFFN